MIYGHTAAQVYHSIFDFDKALQWGDAWKEMVYIEKINDLNDCIYLKADTPRAVTARDFVQFRASRCNDPENPTLCTIVFRNGSHPQYPESWSTEKGFIRGETLGVIGYTIQQIEPRAQGSGKPQLACRVSFCTCFDLKGMIPKRLVNWVASKAPIKWAANLQEAVDKFYP
eukprot:TRINITY_DN683_c0_g1_i9.p1 TRINITY_DN683_c0_g1~~TRINITY_DN683_c0_g1_i9.p1  ORF type:complete len:171 (-),score=40.50 TRINITY_DN683_c0_g1_i9:584-1096(-)